MCTDVTADNDLFNQPARSWHMAAFVHAWPLLFEFPFVALIVISLWRFPVMWTTVLRARTVSFALCFAVMHRCYSNDENECSIAGEQTTHDCRTPRAVDAA